MKQELQATNARKGARAIVAAAIASVLCLLVSLVPGPRESASVHAQVHAPVRLASASFADGGDLPRRLTCDGADDSPELHWSSPPAGTRSFAILMSDPDAPIDFTHWLAYDIPSGVRRLAEGASARGGMPQGSAQGTNSFGRYGYGGPCPPPGKPHHYVFRLYALDGRLALPPGAARDQMEAAIKGHALAEGQLIGIYRRPTQ
jgi:Raf kinase inhibitor-like YbhB/YbcL family protein